MEPDLAATPARILEILEAAVATMIKTPEAGPRVAAATAEVINSPGPLAMQCVPMKVTNNSSNPGVITVVNRVPKAGRWVIVITTMIYFYLYMEDPV